MSDSQQVVAFGRNDKEQCLVPALDAKRVTQVAAGDRHTVLLFDDGTVKGFGANEKGQCTRPPSLVDGTKKAKQVAAGARFTVLLFDDGTVSVLGDPWYSLQSTLSHLGGKKVVHVAAGGYRCVLILEDGAVLASGIDDKGQTTVPPLPPGRRAVQAATSGNHALLVLDDGSAVAFGRNKEGQCDIPSLDGRRVRQAAAGNYHTVLVMEDGTVVAFGSGMTRCMPDLGGRKVVEASCGCSRHTILLLDDGSVLTSGGYRGETDAIPGPVADGSRKVRQVAAGDLHTVLLLEDLDSAAEISKLEAAVRKAEEESKEWKAKCASLEVAVSKAEVQAADAERQATNLKARLTETQVEQLQARCAEAEQELQPKSATISALEEQVSEKQREVEQSQARCAEAERDSQRKSATITGLEEQVSEKQREVGQSQTRCAEADRDSQRKSATITALEEQVAESQRQAEQVRADLQGQVAQRESEVRSQKDTIQRLTASCAQLQAELAKQATPQYWSGASSSLVQGWAATPVAEEKVLEVLRKVCAARNPLDLGGKNNQLELHCAWRIEDSALWARFATEREIVARQLASLPEAVRPLCEKSRLNEVAKDLPGPLNEEVNESWFLHGAKPESLLQLLNTGLHDRMTASSAPGACSGSICLAEDIGNVDQIPTSDGQCQRPTMAELHARLFQQGGNSQHPNEDLFYCFVVRGICGAQLHTRGLERAPGGGRFLRDEESGIQVITNAERSLLVQIPGSSPPVSYHSLACGLGGAQKKLHREFVFFDAPRTYIEYVLAYKRADRT